MQQLRWAATAVVVVGLVIGGATLGLGADPPLREARGTVVGVRGGSTVHADALTLRIDDGRTFSIRIDPDLPANRDDPQSAWHLRQHAGSGQPMVAHYLDTWRGPLLVRHDDG